MINLGVMRMIVGFVALFAASAALSARAEQEYQYIDVPEGEVFTNTTSVSANSTDTILVKTGKGEYVLGTSSAQYVYLGSPTKFKGVEIREGVLRVLGEYSEISTANSGIITVKSGAGLVLVGKNMLRYDPAYIHIEEGGYVDCGGDGTTYTSANLLGVSGAGELRNCPLTSKALTKLANFTGTIATTITTVYGYLGGGASEEDDVPFENMVGLRVNTESYNSGRMYIRNVGDSVINRVWGYGAQLNFSNGSATINEAEIGSVHVSLNSANESLTVRGGDMAFHTGVTDIGLRYAANSNTVCFMNGTYGGTPAVYGAVKLKRPSAIPLVLLNSARKSVTNATLVVSNATVVMYGTPKNVFVQGGGRFCANATTGFGPTADSTAASPQTIHLDGGSLVALSDLASSADCNFFSGGARTRVVVEGSGGFIRSEGLTTPTTVNYHNNTTRMLLGAGTVIDGIGDLTVGGSRGITVNEPFGISGALKLTDGGWLTFANTDNLKNSVSVTGGGDLHLGSAYLTSAFSSGSTVRLAGGEGAKIHLTGAATVSVGASSNNAWSFGCAGEQGVPFVRSAGGVMTFQVPASFFDETPAAQIQVAGSTATDTRGLYPVPIVLYAQKGNNNSNRMNLFFGTVGGDGKVVAAAERTDLEGGASSLARITDYNKSVSGEVSVGGLIVNAKNTDSYTMYPDYSAAVLKLAEGATLKVGHGYGYAPLLLVNLSDKAVARIGGAGTLDFGSAEGIVAVNRWTTGVIDCRIAGTGGLTYAFPYGAIASSGDDSLPERGYVVVAGDNTYSGGTRIHMAAVRPQTSTAFGVGDVYVAGDMSPISSQVRVDAGLDLAFANDFHLAGWGVNDTGAIHAKGRVEISGTTELTAPTRLVAATTDAAIEFSGDLVGGADLYVHSSMTNTVDAKAYELNGRVVLSGGTKTHTGRIEVGRSTLEIKYGAMSGEGGIALDDGRLVVEVDGPVSMASAVTGVGTVALEGRGAKTVSFRGADVDSSWYQSDLSLDLCGRNRAVNSLRGFTSVASSGSMPVKLFVTNAGEPAFEGTVGENVEIVYGSPTETGFIIILR